MSTQLKKEFSPEDLQRARNIITGILSIMRVIHGKKMAKHGL